MTKWVNIKHNILPPDYERVLILLDYGGFPVVAYRQNKQWHTDGSHQEVKCTAHCYGGYIEKDFEDSCVVAWLRIPNYCEEENK